MNKTKSIVLFNQKEVRRIWDEKNEIWYFSIVDIVEILTNSPRPRKYWNALKTKLKQEGSELSQKVGQLKLESPDQKEYFTAVVGINELKQTRKTAHKAREIMEYYELTNWKGESKEPHSEYTMG